MTDSLTPGELVTKYFESLVVPAEKAPAESLYFPLEQKEPVERLHVPEEQKQTEDVEDSEEETESEEESDEEESAEPVKDNFVDSRQLGRYPVDVITLEALLYSHLVLNCGGQEFHAPVLSSLMVVSIISLTPAPFFVGIGVGVPLFWLVQRCLAR
jgi:hypothetical protein